MVYGTPLVTNVYDTPLVINEDGLWDSTSCERDGTWDFTSYLMETVCGTLLVVK